MLFNKKDFDSKQRFSIRKLSVGVCSVLLSTLFLTFNEGQTVHASTDVNAADATTTSVSSNTTNNSSDNNTDKKDDSKVEASSLATAEKHAPIPIAAEIKSNKSEDQTNSASAETDTQVSKSKQAQSQTTINIVKATATQASTSSKDSSDTTSSKDNSAQNTVEKNRSTSTSKYTPVLTSETSVSTKTNQSNSNSATQEKSNIKPVTPHADSTEHIAPETYTMDSDSPAYVVAGSDLTNLASKFISNADALTQSGATFSWDGNVPTATQQDAIDGNTISGTIRVTYKDGTSTTIDIESYVEARSQLQPSTFYYVNRVNDTPDFNTADANGNDFSTILNNTYVYDPTAFSYKILGTLDTSSLGIHWANVQVTDNNTFAGDPDAPKVIGGLYVVKVPYVVQGLKLRDDIPTDDNGNPVINAQLATMPKSTSTTPTTPEVAFDPAQGNSTNFPAGLWGQYFYQDYALAYALGIKVQVAEDDLVNNGKWKNKPTDLVNTKTNHFAITFNKLSNATQQEVDVNYVSAPHAEDMYIYNATGKTYMTGRPENANKIKELLADGYMNDKVWVTLADGTKVYASELEYIENRNNFVVGGARSGKYNINFNASFNQKNSAGQPLIFSNNIFSAASKEFNDELNKWYQKTNNPTVANYAAPTATTWDKVSTNGISLAPTIKASDDPHVQTLTNGPVTFDSEALEKLVKNPSTGAEVKKVQGTWIVNMTPNPILDNNTKWPEGTKLTWAGNDGSTKLTFDKAGESKTGNVTITLPSGSSYTVKDITVISKANVIAKSETVDYGTTLTAADLVTNKNVFPEGTTYQFVDNSEPTWGTAGSYNNVKITATYKDASGASVTTPVANCAVAINDSRSIKVLVGSDVPSVDSVLNLPSTWEEHTASWTTSPNTNSTNEGVITIHYPASNLDQQIKVYVTVIPKTTAVDGQNFFTNGEKYDGTTGSIANGNNQGAILTQANGQAIDYTAYSGTNTAGTQTSYNTKTTSYTPTYSLSGLQTNSDGSLVSGAQTATVRVSVPKGTLGAKVDTDGNYYYEVNAKVNITQPVTFEFVDEYKNDQVVGQTYSQEFIPGVATNLNFNMAMPDGYELGNGASIPSQYTLTAFSQTTLVVQVPIHQKMHFYITFHDEDSNTNLGTVDVSGSAAAGNGGYYPNINTKLTFPAGANAGDYYSVSTSGVPDGVQLLGSYGVPLTDPKADWTTPNYQWENTFSVLKALTGATMTINLKHKIQETQEQQTRKPTVNYIKAKVNADGTYTPDGSAFTSAVLDVYYSRTKSKDLVTKKVTYTPWLWDTKQGQNGYHVESGKWTSLPQQWAAVVADVPTLDGYTAATITDKSGQLANQFVFPTWNNSDQDTSDINKESIAYTANAPIYEARPVHTVLYIPNETQTRTVTENYVYADAGDLTGEEVFSPYKLEIFYKKTGSLNVSTNTITYSGWSWDTDAGDSDTPGFHVISGQGNWTGLGSNGQPSGSSLGINVPTKDGYTAIISAYPAAIYSSTVFGNPGVNSGTGYTNDTDSTWYWRNSLTTYYVPNSKLSKTVTRTINITQPGKETETTVQKSTITRTAHLNVNDSGIAYNDWGTDSMYWYALNVPKVGGYTMTVTKTVNGVTTPIQLVNGQIPAETVNGTSQDTTINITWGAVATATLTGTGTSTYNGQAITNAELNNALKVNVTGPTAGAGTYTLQAGDVEFSTDGTNWTTALPINAGNYQVRLTAQGKNGIIGKYGNNSIIWTQNGQSTITSNATYMINKLADNAVMANAQSGNYEMTYNGAAPSTIDPSKFVFTTTVNGQTVTLDATGLNSSDFTWADGNAPVNVGTYKVVLTDAGLAKLNANNPNFDLTNSGNGTFTINQANASATLSGSASREYNGQAVSVDDLNSTSTGNNITLTLHYPKDGNANYSTTVKLNTGYFTWNTPNGQAPVNANDQPYTISLNSDAIEGIIKQAVGSGQNGVSNVKFANNAISGSASYKITPLETAAELSNITDGNYTKVYDAQATNQIDASKLHITANLGGQNVDLDTTGLTGSDYQWVDASGTALTYNPKNVGTYYIKLSDTAFAKLQAQNPNFQLTSNDGLGVYTITPTTANITFGGTNSRVYNGQGTTTAEINSNGQIKIHFTFPGSVSDASYTLKDRDYYLVDQAGAGYDGAQIINVGTYTIKLTQQGMQNVIDTIHQLSGSGDSGYNINVDSATQLGNLTSTFNIVPSQNMISVSGTQTETYNGSPINVVYNADGTNSVKVSIAQTSGNTTGAVASLTDVTLDSGDFAIVNGPAENAGSYQVKLTDAGLAKIQNAVGDNYHISIDPNAFGTLVIKKYKASAVFSGDPSYTYTGTPVSADDYLGKYSITLNEPNNPTYNLVAGDIEFNVDGNWTSQAPVKVGTYQVRLSQSGWNHIKAINSDNVEWAATASAGKGSYTIDQAKVTADLSGNNSMIYNGSHVTTADLYTEGSTIKVAINGTGIANLPKSFTLEDGDYTWSTSDNQSPVNVGNYTIKLTQAGINKIQSQIDQVVGAGNVVLTTTADDGGSASFEIKQAVAANVQLYGRENTIYNGNPVSFDPTKTETANNFGFHNVENLTVPTFTASDFTWYDETGNKLESAPVDVGTYQARLNASTLAELQNTNPNYQFSSVAGLINYTINPAPATAKISGSADRDYNAQTTSVSDVMNNIKWKATGLVTDQELNLNGLTANSYAWYSKDADGNYVAMTGNPVNAGTYYLRLTKDAIAQVKADNSNYNFTSVDGEFTYTINVVNGTATLRGSSSKTYDGQAATTAEVNSTNGDIIVNFAFPGSSAQSTYALQAGDYIWENKDGQEISAPTNAGTYTIKLSADGITNLQNAINQYAGQGNVTLDAQDLLGAAVYTIKQKALNVILGNNSTGTDGKTYDGQPAVINTQAENFGVFTTSGLVNGEDLNAANLTNDDYEWVDANGKAISAPTNAGTYYISLTANGLKKLQADNPNYAISESGQFTYVISPAEENVTISGSQESTSTSIDNANFTVHAPAGITVPTGMTYEFATGVPSESGVYVIKLTPESIAALEKTNPNYKLNISSDARFTLDATLSIEFEDTQDGNKQVGKTITKTGVANSTINDLKLVVPDNYELAPDQELPTSYTFGKTLNQNLYIKLVHKLNELNPTDPSTNPDPTNKNWFRENGLVKDVTRTINYEGLSTAQLAQIPETQKAQTVEFTRTAKYDLVTGKIVVNSEGSWTAVDGKDIFAGFTPFAFAGYTAAPAKVEQVKVTGNDKNSQITVTYTANNQTGKISYVDSDGKEVGQTTISGKTGETVKVTPEAPTGWQIVSGQDIPETVVATPTGVPTVVVKVTHSTITVTPETPEKDIPTGPVPGDPSKNYEKMESLTASPTRTIVVTDPSGRTTKVTQIVNFTRTATFDEVTGEITYSDWTSSEPAEWSEYTAPEVAGYTATQMVKSQAVSAETKNETVSISYTANNQTGKISYVDSQGNEVGQTALTGKTDQNVAVTPEAPTGWIIVAGQDIPKSVTATATGIPTVTVRVEHSTTIVTPETPEKDIPTGPVPGDPSKDYEKMESLTASPTRTIVVSDPSGKTTEVTQTVNFTRMATFDEVTGEITYSNWASSEPAEWSEYTAPEVAGYTATSSVSAKPVTAKTADETVSISYTANNQTGKISYVDGDGKEVGQTTISGQTGETVNVTPQVPSGWKIVPGQDIPKTITISENGIPTVTVKVEHGTVIVTPDTPEKDIPTGPVPGDLSKNYEKMESLTATPTRTIVVTDPSGKTTKVTQTVNFTRTATFDEVTGRVTYSDWKLQNSNASNHAAQWDSYTPHVITHYVPSVAEVPAKVVNSHTANSQVEITYAPASESQVIRYVDQNGKEISTQIVSGKYGLDTTFTAQLPNNWQAANTIPTSIKIGENGGLTTIIVEAKTEKVQQSKTVTETIHYHTANGKQLFADKEMEVNFFRTGVKNLVTGEITWNNWNKDKESLNEVLSPKVSGYTASPAKVAAQTVTPNSEDLVFNVIYTKNSQTYPTIPENKPNKPQEENVSKQETKTQDKLIHEYGYKKRADGRLVDHTGHVYPASSKVKENGAIYSEKGELLSVGSRRKHELPQTGLHDNSLIAAIGSLLAGISIFGLLGGRKKKDDDK